MENKRIWKRTERELKRNLIIWFTSWIMVYGITSLWEIIWIIFIWTWNLNNIRIEIIIFAVKIIVVWFWFAYWIKFIKSMKFNE